MSNMIQIGDQMFFHPGYYLQEWLEEKNMSVEEFADKTNISSEDIKAIIAGDKLMKGLERIEISDTTGIGTNTWQNLETAFLRGIYLLRIPKPVWVSAFGEIGCPNCKSGFGLKDEDGDPNKFCGQCGQALSGLSPFFRIFSS